MKRLTIACVITTLAVMSCSTTGSKRTSSKNGNGDYPNIEALIQQTDLDEDAASGGETGLRRASTEKHKVPRVINESVNKWIIYFTKQNPDWFQRALTRSEEYETDMKNILINSEVPEELFYLALIESAFVKRAGSHAGAKGIWQFMKGTARLYGLQVKRGLDERYDPYKSTAAAAAYLKDLYNIYGSWYLAIASYNAGEGRIRNAILKHRERSFWELAAKNALPEETMNYVPKYIAAVIVAENYRKFGFAYNGPSSGAPVVAEDVNKLVAMDKFRRGAKPSRPTGAASGYAASSGTETYIVKRGDNLSKIADRFGTTISDLKYCNERIHGSTIGVGQRLRINCERATQIAKAENKEAAKEISAAAATVVAANAPAPASAATVVRPSKVEQDTETKIPRTYRVKYGDTLEGIGKKYSLSVEDIKDCNPTVQRYQILAGQRLKLTCTKETVVAAGTPSYKVHVVRPGESLWSISSRYGVSVNDIMKWNNLKSRSVIFKGRRLKIYS
ncbi:MAG: LysM peptidoglycan-binding domain-containing protein [Pseudomonadota bacterium]